jgi:hypothetical protein
MAALSALSARAPAEAIRFYVDDVLVAELYSAAQPTAMPIKLAGRSGAYGTSERSGLYDNVFVELGGSTTVCDDDFMALDTGYWGSYGSPQPHLLTDFGDPAPCLMTSGDDWNDSGLYSLQSYDWSDGFVFEADVHVNSTDDYHNVEFGIADAVQPDGEQLGHVIGVNWKNGGGGLNVLRCTTDAGSLEVPAATTGAWHRIRISSEPSPPPVPVRFWVDGAMVAVLESSLQPSARPIKLAGRSGSGGTDERSGLFDNAFVVAGGGATVCEDRFLSLNTGYWGLYGSPEPRLLPGFGNTEPCLMTSGDWINDSGVYSHGTFDWRFGFQIQADVYIDSANDYHSVEFGIADRNVPAAEQFGHVIGLTWEGESQRATELQCVTDMDYTTVAGPSLNAWHTIIITTYDPPLDAPWTAVEASTWGSIKALFKSSPPSN